MLEGDAIERERAQVFQRQRAGRLRLLRHRQNFLEDVQRGLCFPVHVDDVAELLQRAEDEERIDPEREELAHGDGAHVNEVQHHEQDARAQKVDDRSLDEAERPQVLHFLQLELQDFPGSGVQPLDFLLPKPQALHQLDVSQRLCRRARERGGFRHDHLLNRLDALAEDPTDDAKHGNREEIHRCDKPVHAVGIDHHEDDAHQRGEQHVDRRRDQLLDVGPHFLELAQRFAAALVLEDGVRELQRVADAVGVELRAQPLRHQVDVVVLEVLRHARDEGHAHRRRQQKADAPEELPGGVLRKSGCVAVDDIPEDERIQ